MSESASDLDQGFNEEELEDIMNEIESLESDSVNDTEAPSATIDTDMSAPDEVASDALEPVGEEFDAALEPVDEGLSETIAQDEKSVHEEVSVEEEIPVEKVAEVVELRKTQEVPEATKAEISHGLEGQPTQETSPKSVNASSLATTVGNEEGAKTQMDFNVSGNLNLKLNFKVGQNTVSLEVDQKVGLVIEMENGVKFTVPFSCVDKKAA